jgi:hypothetical protein
MRSIEIQPRNGSHYVIVDGKEWSRHNDVKIAEQVRRELIREQVERKWGEGWYVPELEVER